jgi:hypothetical protein
MMVFYELVQEGMESRSKGESEDANEVVDVINSVLDFSEWGKWMKEMASNPQMRM